MTQTDVYLPEGLRARKIELVLQQLDRLPTLPAIALRLLTLTGAAETNTRDVVETIALDPALTAKLLSLVQSAATGVRSPITTVQQAVVLLGMEAVRNLVLSVKVFEIFQAAEPGAFDRTGFWKHSLAVATAAEMLPPTARPRWRRRMPLSAACCTTWANWRLIPRCPRAMPGRWKWPR